LTSTVIQIRKIITTTTTSSVRNLNVACTVHDTSFNLSNQLLLNGERLLRRPRLTQGCSAERMDGWNQLLLHIGRKLGVDFV
jgi:hypothetical protein